MRGRREATAKPRKKHAPPPPSNTTYVSWGANKGAALGLGFGSVYQYFAFAQPGILENIKEVCFSGAGGMLRQNDGTIYTWGYNSYGTVGLGTAGGGGEEEEKVVPEVTKLAGGWPIYRKETLKGRKASFEQPEGPLSPILDPKVPGAVAIKAMAGTGPIRALLTMDGRALTWGSNGFGQLGNGWETPSGLGENPIGAWTATTPPGMVWRPQWAPYWVLTGPGPTSEGNPKGAQELWPDERNVLKNITQVSAGKQVTYYVTSAGKLFVAGTPTGSISKEGGPYVFATEDPLWVKEKATLGGAVPVEVACSSKISIALLSNGRIRVFGVNGEGEGTFGDGSIAPSPTGFRQLIEPKYEVSPGVYAPLEKVVQVATGMYHSAVIKDDGTFWTWGTNKEAQLGKGEDPTPSYRPIQITALGSKASPPYPVEIHSGQEEYGLGMFGGDIMQARMSDGTMKVWGKNYDAVAGTAATGNPVGSLGDFTTTNKWTPVQVPNVSGVTQCHCNSIAMIAVVPGTAAAPSVKVTLLGNKEFKVDWLMAPYPITVPPSMPRWRDPDTLEVKYRRTERDPATYNTINPTTGKTENPHGVPEPMKKVNSLPGSARSIPIQKLTPATWAEASDEIEVIIEEEQNSATRFTLIPNPSNPAELIESYEYLASGGSIKLEWHQFSRPEPAAIAEWRRVEEYTDSKGKKHKEPFARSPELFAPPGGEPPTTFETSLAPSNHGLTGNLLEVVIYGLFGGTPGPYNQTTKKFGLGEGGGAFQQRFVYATIL